MCYNYFMPRRLIASLVFLSLFCASAPEAVHEVFHAAASSLQHTHDGGDCCHLHSFDYGHTVRGAAVSAASSRRQYLPFAGTAGDLSRSLPAPLPAAYHVARSATDLFTASKDALLLPQLLPIPPPPSRIA